MAVIKDRRKKSKLLVKRKTSKKTVGGARKGFNSKGATKTRTSKKKRVAKSTKKSRKLSGKKKRKNGKKVTKGGSKKKGGIRNTKYHMWGGFQLIKAITDYAKAKDAKDEIKKKKKL
jgi:hypothetical protein